MVERDVSTPQGFTPGPWTVTGDGAQRLIFGDGLHIASVPAEDAEDRANARLIAAAPDLLAALAKIQAITRGDRACDYENDVEAAADIDAIARAAIAKAQG